MDYIWYAAHDLGEIYDFIYRVMEKNVFVLLIVDGRRDMQALLQRRLLGA